MTWSWILMTIVHSVAMSTSALALAVIIHESGHYVAARLAGRKAEMRWDRHGPHVWHEPPAGEPDVLPPLRQAAITLSGAAANLLAAAVLPGVWGLAQAGLAAWTLLWPHPLSDGWRAVRVLSALGR